MGGLIVGLILALSAGGGVSLAAEGAVPGSLLYPVKTEVTEPVRGAFMFSSEAKARWNTRLAERRLEEAGVLAARGELTSETRAELEARLQKRTENAETRAARFEAAGDAEKASAIRARVEGALSAHAEILERVEASLDTSADARVEVRNLLGTVRMRAREAMGDRIETSASVGARLEGVTETAARGKITAASNVLETAQRAFDRNTDDVDERTRVSVEADLRASAEAIARAEAHLEAGETREAFIEAQGALRLAHRARAHMRGSLRVQGILPVHSVVDVSGGAEIETSAETGGAAADTDVDAESDSTDSGSVDSGTPGEGSVDVDVRGEADADGTGSAGVEAGADVDARLEF